MIRITRDHPAAAITALSDERRHADALADAVGFEQ